MNKEGRRASPSLLRELADAKGLLVAIIVCERNNLFEGARGPPGTEGAFDMFIVRGVGFVGGFFVKSFGPDEEDEETGLAVAGFSRLPDDILAFRPREAKNPPALEVGVDGTTDRIEEVGVALAVAGSRWLWASEGYGSAGGAVGVISVVLSDRSVAVEASSRRGKVASEVIEARDVCLGCGVNVLLPAKTGRFMLARILVSIIQSPKPESYMYSSLIFCAYMTQRSPGFFREYTSEQYMADGYCDLIFRLGRRGGDENGTDADNENGTGSDGDGVLAECCALSDKRFDDLDDLDDMEGVRGSEDNRFRFVVKLFLKLLGGGLGVSLLFLCN